MTSAAPTWTIRWVSDRGSTDSFRSDRLERVQEAVLDLLRRELEFQVQVTHPRPVRAD